MSREPLAPDAAPIPERAELQLQMQTLLRDLAVLRGHELPAAQRQSRAWLKAWQVQRLAQTHAQSSGSNNRLNPIHTTKQFSDAS